MMYHVCSYCQTGPFCDCGRAGTDDLNQYTTDQSYASYIKRQTEDWLMLNTDGLDYIARLNTAIKNTTEVDTCSEDTMSWKEWIAMGKILLRATLLKRKSHKS